MSSDKKRVIEAFVTLFLLLFMQLSALELASEDDKEKRNQWIKIIAFTVMVSALCAYSIESQNVEL